MMKHVAPALGVLVACMLFASPLKAVKGVRQTRQLGVRAAMHSPSPAPTSQFPTYLVCLFCRASTRCRMLRCGPTVWHGSCMRSSPGIPTSWPPTCRACSLPATWPSPATALQRTRCVCVGGTLPAVSETARLHDSCSRNGISSNATCARHAWQRPLH